jgi:hypothetical protein
MITRIHVNQLIIRANRKNGTNDPVVSVKRGRSNNYAHEVEIDGPSRVIYRPEKPLACGARCWVETEGDVRIIK